jgi:hypothetical protein
MSDELAAISSPSAVRSPATLGLNVHER